VTRRTGAPAAVDHAAQATRFLSDVARASWHDEQLWRARQKRDRAVHRVPEWEELRALAAGIKDHALSHLDRYLMELEANATAHGIRVHWAGDAAEHNRIVRAILEGCGARRIVKSKSMLTEECGLNPYLEARGIDVVDSDLGEFIMQLSGKPPSHIVTPAIHVSREEVGALFHEKLGTDAGASDPQVLAAAARRHLRNTFLAADAAITGVNFAVAETGGFVVCTNEGNADLGAHVAPVHIACMGIDKVIPRAEHLGVFLRLLARSGTGQALTVYTSHFSGPRPGGELHLVLVDNGRSAHLGRADFRTALRCIRCGACMNTCPVYRRSGGYSYGATVPGPLGSILTPGIDLRTYAALPFASTLCRSCSDVCPVRIDIHAQLYAWRQVVARAGLLPRGRQFVLRVAGQVLSRPALYRAAARWTRRALRVLPRFVVYGRYNVWGRARELPELPKRSFREWYVRTRGES
jgi:L-lactate dehydrogenase complex protein LldF